MANLTDCFFYFKGCCAKGNQCLYRHEPAALGSTKVCQWWLQGKCYKRVCNQLHFLPKKQEEYLSVTTSTEELLNATVRDRPLHSADDVINMKKEPIAVDLEVHDESPDHRLIRQAPINNLGRKVVIPKNQLDHYYSVCSDAIHVKSLDEIQREKEMQEQVLAEKRKHWDRLSMIQDDDIRDAQRSRNPLTRQQSSPARMLISSSVIKARLDDLEVQPSDDNSLAHQDSQSLPTERATQLFTHQVIKRVPHSPDNSQLPHVSGRQRSKTAPHLPGENYRLPQQVPRATQQQLAREDLHQQGYQQPKVDRSTVAPGPTGAANSHGSSQSTCRQQTFHPMRPYQHRGGLAAQIYTRETENVDPPLRDSSSAITVRSDSIASSELRNPTQIGKGKGRKLPKRCTKKYTNTGAEQRPYGTVIPAQQNGVSKRPNGQLQKDTLSSYRKYPNISLNMKRSMSNAYYSGNAPPAKVVSGPPSPVSSTSQTMARQFWRSHIRNHSEPDLQKSVSNISMSRLNRLSDNLTGLQQSSEPSSPRLSQRRPIVYDVLNLSQEELSQLEQCSMSGVKVEPVEHEPSTPSESISSDDIIWDDEITEGDEEDHTEYGILNIHADDSLSESEYLLDKVDELMR